MSIIGVILVNINFLFVIVNYVVLSSEFVLLYKGFKNKDTFKRNTNDKEGNETDGVSIFILYISQILSAC